jgi:hypothetical protein
MRQHQRMSAIASFYVVPAERLPDIVVAAAPVKSGWFRRSTDKFWRVLHDIGRELEPFAGSGWAFNTLDLYLETRHGFMFDRFGDPDASDCLSRLRGSYWLVLPQDRTVALLAALATVPRDPEGLAVFLRDEHGTDAVDEEVAAIEAALTTLRAWLAEIPLGSVGLLSVG